MVAHFKTHQKQKPKTDKFQQSGHEVPRTQIFKKGATLNTISAKAEHIKGNNVLQKRPAGLQKGPGVL